MTAGEQTRGTINVLQAGRALAALSVVMMHTIFPTAHMVGRLPIGAEAVLSQGYLGVDFFFVLSGFIIYYTNHAAARKQGWASRYIETRMSRIYLPYLPVGIGVALMLTALPGAGQGGQPWSWLSTLTLLPHGPQSALGVAWSLTYELVFYFLAFIFFLTGRPITCALIWGFAILSRYIAGPAFNPPPDLTIEAVLLNQQNLEFVFGMLAAWAVIHNRIGNVLLIGSGALCIATFILDGAHREHSFIFGLGVAFWIIPLIRMEMRKILTVPVWLVLLGNASYAIYLIHQPLLSVTSRTVARLGPAAMWQVNLVVGISAAIAVGIAYHLLFEKPVLAFVRAIVRGGFLSRCAVNVESIAKTKVRYN